MNVVVIPARGGSKRIPKKNIKSFYGKPLIYYAIKSAIKSIEGGADIILLPLDAISAIDAILIVIEFY